MTILEGKQFTIQSILNLYDLRESTNIASYMIESITGMNKTDQAINKQKLLLPNQIEKIQAYSKRLKQGEPMQYVLEEAWFLGNRFKVNKDTLIPRPETEELVEWVLEDLKKNHQDQICLIDIGTGSGCIPISIGLKHSVLQILAIDISKNALSVAQENAIELNQSVQFEEIDFLDESKWARLKPVNIIVSNPPYIKEAEKNSMHQNVVNFEPHQALFVPDEDGLLFYRKIVQFSQTHLLPGGLIYLEINEALGKEVVALFSTLYASVELKKDIFGKDRMVRIRKNN
jgi:release factor glutamine methyltransferase